MLTGNAIVVARRTVRSERRAAPVAERPIPRVRRPWHRAAVDVESVPREERDRVVGMNGPAHSDGAKTMCPRCGRVTCQIGEHPVNRRIGHPAAIDTGIAVRVPRQLVSAARQRPEQRLGGHLVAGHVDGVGTIRRRAHEGNSILFTIEAPPDILRHCVMKGSVTVDGTSLTVNEVSDRDFSIAIIPHTAKNTTLGLKQVDDAVNLESDLIGKYVERLLHERNQLSRPAPAIDKDYLQKRGLI